jgi:hypothetical protein
MKGWIRRTCKVCVVAWALGAPLAYASTSGTITFVGAIVVPTCNVGDAAAIASAAGGYQRCAAPAATPSAPVSSYRQDVVSLETAMEHPDRLLGYFAGYASARDTQILTRTYE